MSGRMIEMGVRYPNVEVPIWEAYPFVYYDEDAEDEEDGDYSPDNPDASRVLERVRSALREGGVSDEEIEAYTREATSRCYNHLMYTTMTWVRIRWVGPDYEPDESSPSYLIQ